jgi:arginyl-tRNA--protein-N-Asp/Glu arginylyltransferase
MTLRLPHFYRVYVVSDCRSMVYKVTRVYTGERARYPKGVLTNALPALFENGTAANFEEGEASAK